MIHEISIKLPVDDLNDQAIYQVASQLLHIAQAEITGYDILKKSIDARKRQLYFNLKLRIVAGEEYTPLTTPKRDFKDVSDADPVYIIGAGPAGLFAGLRCLELGKKPIIIERGKNVRERRRDLAKLNKEHIVNPESNYCFGEGGAGTYSDGKLYTRSKKRGDVEKVLETLIQFGANPVIKVDAHPHVGTNKLPGIISAISELIIQKGGEIRFNTKMTNLFHENGALTGIEINAEYQEKCSSLILATGHSARDIYEILHQQKVLLEPKSFAVGVRIEHPREYIDQVQYHGRSADDVLPPASYSLVEQVDGRGVFSFCMCPGGIVAPCATEEGQVVTNGWSPSKRNNAWSNSGLVVSVDEKDYGTGPLDGLNYQRAIEKKAWELAGKTQKAPAQKVADFINGRVSANLPTSSYIPGLTPVNLHDVLPKVVAKRLRKALQKFDQKMPGYVHPDSVLIGVETRTSSPLRIPRDKESLMHPEIQGLFPCAEGAGFAGGIVSAAIDGERCALAAIAFLSGEQ
ncbi:MAG: putative FAD-dependent dehydrogenase [Luteibaculaceae bacterium]|jgi:uncharacterized FAD-dependent dehydrogenase